MPTVVELAALGLAEQVRPGIYRVSNAGHALMGEVMARNATRSRTYRSNQ